MNKISTLFLFGIFFLLDFSYQDIIVPIYAHSGFYYVEPSFFKSFLSCALAAWVIFLANNKSLSIFAQFILLLICMFLCFPAILLFKNMSANPEILTAHLLYFTVTYVFFKYIPIRIKSKSLKVNQRFSVLFFTAIILTIPFFIVHKFNVNLNNLLLIDIYETRFLHRGLGNAWLAYTYTWVGKIVLPFSVLFSLNLKKPVSTIILSIMLIYIFLIGAHKSILIGSFVIIAYYFIPKKYFLMSLTLGVLSLLIFGHITYILYDNYYITGLITRRVFFIPALLDTCYFDFFDSKPLFWSNSFLKHLIDYPYELKPTYLIGSEYFNRTDMNANIGIISEGYSNLGWGGVLINIIIVSGIFSFFNSLQIHAKFYGIFLFFFFNTVSSGLPTILLTHGGALLLILSQFILKDTSDQTEALNYD